MNITHEKIITTFDYQMAIDGGDVNKAVINTVEVLQKPIQAVVDTWKKYALSTSADERNGDLCQALEEIEAAV